MLLSTLQSLNVHHFTIMELQYPQDVSGLVLNALPSHAVQ